MQGRPADTTSGLAGEIRIIGEAERGMRLAALVPRMRAWLLLEIAAAVAGALLFALIVGGGVPTRIVEAYPGLPVLPLLAALLFLGETAAVAAASRGDSAAQFARAMRAAGLAILLVAVFVVSALPLARAWQAGRGGYFAIGGLLPWSDASNYYEGAVEVKERASLNFWNQRRPLNAAINSLKLRAGGSVQGWLVAASLLLAAALTLAVREIALEFGLPAAALFLAVVCSHGEPYWFTTMSEPNGLLLGTLATTVLLAAARLRSVAWFVAGVFILGLALEARAGAFFVLPLLWVWGASVLGGDVRRKFVVGALAILLTLLAFAPARLYDRLWANGRGAAHANLAPTLYGLAADNKGWRQVFEDYPHLEQMRNEEQSSKFIYERAFELVRERPFAFAGTLARGVGLFAVQTGEYVAVPAAAIMSAILAGVLGFGSPVSRLFLAAFAGTLLSAPILAKDGGARVFASTVPLTALAVVLSAAFVQGLVIALMTRSRRPLEARPARGAATPAAAAAIVAALLTAPVLLAGRGTRAPVPTTPPMPEGTSVVFLPRASGEWLDVLPREVITVVRAPVVPPSGVAEDLGRTQISRATREVRAPQSVGLAVDVRGVPSHGDTLTWFLTRPGTLLPHTTRPMLLVGDDRESQPDYHYMLVRRAYVASTDGRRWLPLAP